jgi:hypothetical protein
MSGGKRTGIFIGIAAALAAVILVVVGRDDEKFGPPCASGTPIVISPGGPLPPDPCAGIPL